MCIFLIFFGNSCVIHAADEKTCKDGGAGSGHGGSFTSVDICTHACMSVCMDVRVGGI